MKLLAVVLPLLVVVVAVLLGAEVGRFRAGQHLVSPRRLGLRLVAGGLMILLLVAVFLGLFAFQLRRPEARPALFLVYWSACLVVAVALMLVMLADVKEVEARSAQRRRELRRDFAQSILKAQAAAKQRELTAPEGEPKQ